MPAFRPRFFIADPCLGSTPDKLGVLGTEVALSEVDSHHASRVLRLKQGDECEVVLRGAVFLATVASVGAPLTVVLHDRLQGAEAGAVYRARVGLVQALTRPSLLDQVLEKGTEVGASFFILFPADGSAPLPAAARASRLERWRRIVLEAAKQSKQTAVPPVELVTSMKTAADRLREEGAVSLVLEPSASAELAEALQEEAPLALWVGPEGGWSQQELDAFTQAGMTAAKLGQSVLRAETAGPVAVAATRLLIGDW